jgi:hypothetical protein
MGVISGIVDDGLQFEGFADQRQASKSVAIKPLKCALTLAASCRVEIKAERWFRKSPIRGNRE